MPDVARATTCASWPLRWRIEQTLALLGLDISKWAVLSAAKQDKRPSWVVGSNAKLPVLSGTLDRVLCMFGFPVYAEFARVLKQGGRLVQVDAGPDHLRELREIIYPSLKPERPADLQTPAGFSRLPTETLRFSIELTKRRADYRPAGHDAASLPRQCRGPRAGRCVDGPVAQRGRVG
jgi:SAM-dependent methyltransferase